MKTTLRLTIAAFGLAFFNLSTVVVEAQFNYTATNGTVTITGYAGPGRNVTVPDTINGLPVTSIGDSAFSTSALTSVTIPNSVTTIGGGAFASCGRLTNVTIPNSVTNIGDAAFGYCTSLMAITVDTNNPAYTSLNGILFNKGQTTLVQYPAGIGGSYTIPNTVTRIGDSTFSACHSLTSVTIPNSVTSIGDEAFYGCDSLANVTIPNSVTNIGDYAFDYCLSLTNVTIGNGVSSIGNAAFVQCDSLTNITIPNSVTNIGDSAFWDCSSLTSVTLGNGVISIGNSAFAGCGSLTNVTIPNSVTNIGGWAFGGAPITVDTNNPAYTSLNGILFNKSQTTLVEYSAGIGGSYTIPNSVTSIGEYAFNGCGLTNITIPNSVTNIGDSAFAGCGGLTSVYFKGNAPIFGVGVFVKVGPYMYPWDPATIYYLPGTTGWDTTFGGRPTALWLPLVQTSDATFGVWADQFGFTINWTSGMTVVVEATTSLTNPSWVSLETHTFKGNSFYFSDPDWANYPSRFYRIRSQ